MVRCVVFDIGGMLITQDTPAEPAWEARLGLDPSTQPPLLASISRAGSIGAIDEAEEHRRVARFAGAPRIRLHRRREQPSQRRAAWRPAPAQPPHLRAPHPQRPRILRTE